MSKYGQKKNQNSTIQQEKDISKIIQTSCVTVCYTDLIKQKKLNIKV